MIEIGLHATALVIDEAGILIRGASGSGKSRLARELMIAAMAECRHAALVGDDRVFAAPRHGRLVVRGSPEIAGLLEVRGAGIVRCTTTAAAVVRLVVECGAAAERLPSSADQTTVIATVACPLLTAESPSASLVLWWLRGRNDAIMTIS